MKKTKKHAAVQTVPDVGSIVQSTDGRDRKRVFLVIGNDAQNPLAPVVIADGQLRKSSGAKHKNPAHLRVLGHLVESERKALLDGISDSKIAEFCTRYDFRKEST